MPASSVNGTLTCTLTNAALPVVLISKAARSGSQSPTFNFSVSGATNASQAIPFTPSDSTIQKDRTPEHTGSVGTPVSITEAATANWPSAPASVVCTDLNAAASGNPSVIPVVANNATSTYTVPGANMKLGANIQCVFKNEQPQVSLSKSYVGPVPDAGIITLSISSTNSGTTNAVVTAPANKSTNGGSIPFVFVNAGTTVIVSESAGAGTSLSNYDSSIVCKDGNNLVYPTTLRTAGSWTLTAPTGFITGQSELISCSIINTAKPPTVTIAKNSVGRIGTFDFSLSGVTIGTDTVTTSTPGTTVTSSTVHAGTVGTQAIITEAPASATGYTTAVSCVDANSATTGNTGSISATGTAVAIPASNMKAAAQYTCTFTNTAASGSPRVQIVKTTVSGTGNNLFSFALSGLSQSTDTITVAGVATANGAATLTGTPDTAVSITETSPAGWPVNPVSASCLDSASATPLVAFGTLTGNQLGIPKANMVNGANIVCTFTNSFNNSVSGRVFTDNGAGAGTANDGLINGGEAGMPGVTLKLTNCTGTTFATAMTDGSGNYSLSVPFSTGTGTALCVEETNPALRLSTGASVGGIQLPTGVLTMVTGTSYTYTRATTPDKISFTWNGAGHSALNFGDVDSNTFAGDGAKTGIAGNTVSYPHTFIAQSGGSVSFDIASAVTSPVLAGWDQKIFADPGCTGTLQAGAALLFPPAKSTGVTAGQTVCIVMQEFIPATAIDGYIDTVKVRASFSYTDAKPALALATLLVTDITSVGPSAGEVIKEVRNATQNGVFGVSNKAKSGEVLEYRLTYTNNGTSPITGIALNDVAPNYTSFLNAAAGTTPVTMSNCQKTTPANPAPAPTVACASAQAAGGTGPVSWRFDGTLKPGATGTVLFQVKVD